MDRSKEKSALRQKARALRESLVAPDHAQALAAHADALGIPASAVLGGYVARGDEADPHLLLERLRARGSTVAFPRVVGKDAPLDFHLPVADESMQPGAYGIFEPLAHWPRAVPTVLFVPLLAFDAQGYRLGFGGGYYDRTLDALRVRGSVTAIGVAYAGQEMDSLPHEAHDVPLDAIVTEMGFRAFRTRKE
jgi:5-formyltetrahydrofolate cyclo-ligase